MTSLRLRWLAFHLSRWLSRGQINFSPAVLAVWCHSNPIMVFVWCHSTPIMAFVFGFSCSCSKCCWIRIRRTCCLPSSPVLKFSHLYGWPRQLGRVALWAVSSFDSANTQFAPLLFAQKGWEQSLLALRRDEVLLWRMIRSLTEVLTCTVSRIVRNASQSNVILLCFDRSGLAVMVVVDGAFLYARGTRMTHALESVLLNALWSGKPEIAGSLALSLYNSAFWGFGY